MDKPTNSQLIVDASSDGLVYGKPCTLDTIVVGKIASLTTLTIHDAASESDATNGNRVAVIELDSRGVYPFHLTMRKGIVAVLSAAAAPAVTVVWS